MKGVFGENVVRRSSSGGSVPAGQDSNVPRVSRLQSRPLQLSLDRRLTCFGTASITKHVSWVPPIPSCAATRYLVLYDDGVHVGM